MTHTKINLFFWRIESFQNFPIVALLEFSQLPNSPWALAVMGWLYCIKSTSSVLKNDKGAWIEGAHYWWLFCHQGQDTEIAQNI
jgi:hypothetical protein